MFHDCNLVAYALTHFPYCSLFLLTFTLVEHNYLYTLVALLMINELFV